jgi:TPR repeat protein
MTQRTLVIAAALLSGLFGRSVAGPLEDAGAAFDKGDYKAALAIYRPLAEKGDPVAQAQLGLMYSSGAGVHEDDAQGLAWTQKSAAQGYAPAKEWLILTCRGAVEGPRDVCDRLVADIRALAEKGDAKAETQLGEFYLLGKVLQKDQTQAVTWLRKAADQNYAAADFQLGLAYNRLFMGDSRDDAQSTGYFRKAADLGYPLAIDALAIDYKMGWDGLTRDPVQAAAWYEKSAAKGDTFAMSSLADLYEKGDGVPKDGAKAFSWRLKMAETGDVDAQAKISAAYAAGSGVAQDNIEAWAWIDVAMASGADADGDDKALAKDAIASRLKPAQLDQARRRSQALKAEVETTTAQTAHTLAASMGFAGALPKSNP